MAKRPFYTLPCANCGQLTPFHLLDAKPEALPGPTHTSEERLEHEGDDYTRLECQACYGPGWEAGGVIVYENEAPLLENKQQETNDGH